MANPNLTLLAVIDKFLQQQNIVRLKPQSNQAKKIVISLPYATKNNFVEEQLYKYQLCYLHIDAYKKLQIAAKEAKKRGFAVKILDCYRPFEVQAYMAKKYPLYVEEGYFSHPLNGIASHVRGVAVDLTLLDNKNCQLDMGTEFDDMSIKSSHHLDEISLTEQQKKNRQILMEIMQSAGFVFYENEWWHYNLDLTTEAQRKLYPLVNSHLSLICPEIL